MGGIGIGANAGAGDTSYRMVYHAISRCADVERRGVKREQKREAKRWRWMKRKGVIEVTGEADKKVYATRTGTS